VTVLLLGDSHLARIRRDLTRIAPGVTNRAAGGAFARDLAGQAAGLELASYDAVVVSVGTNDAAPWKRATDFESVVAEFVASRPGVAWVFVRSPGVEESRNSGSGDRTNRELAEYADVAAALFTGAGGEVIDAPALLNELGPAAFTDDGVHLTAAAYDVLIPELARACNTNTRTPRHHEGDGATERNE